MLPPAISDSRQQFPDREAERRKQDDRALHRQSQGLRRIEQGKRRSASRGSLANRRRHSRNCRRCSPVASRAYDVSNGCPTEGKAIRDRGIRNRSEELGQDALGRIIRWHSIAIAVIGDVRFDPRSREGSTGCRRRRSICRSSNNRCVRDMSAEYHGTRQILTVGKFPPSMSPILTGSSSICGRDMSAFLKGVGRAEEARIANYRAIALAHTPAKAAHIRAQIESLSTPQELLCRHRSPSPPGA